MKSNEVIREAMKLDGISQAKLAERMGYNSQGAVGNALARENGMRVDVFIKMMKAMGWTVVVERGKERIEVSE
jgi:transcriptional regulator with XRE-family HTH domain